MGKMPEKKNTGVKRTKTGIRSPKYLKKLDKKIQLAPTMLESLAGCRTMFLFAVSSKIGALERNTY